MDQIIRIGMDTSKHVFQLHGVNAADEPVLRKKLRRKEMVVFFQRLAPTVIAIEACGGSHHWARLLGTFGHQVKLIAPQLAKPYVKRGKNDPAAPLGGWQSVAGYAEIERAGVLLVLCHIHFAAGTGSIGGAGTCMATVTAG